MNRRQFIAGLLASSAAVPVAKVAAADVYAVTTKWAPEVHWRQWVRAADVEYIAIYYSRDAKPMMFTGFRAFVPGQGWLSETYDIVEG